MMTECKNCHAELEIADLPQDLPKEAKQSLIAMACNILCDTCAMKQDIAQHEKDTEIFLRRSRLIADDRAYFSGIVQWDEALGRKNARLLAWMEANLDKSLFVADVGGAGKTRASIHLCAKYRKRYPWAMFWRSSDLMERLMQLYGESMFEMDALKSRIMELDLFILDDFGKEKLSDRAGQVVYDLIDNAYRNNRRIWITSNITDGREMLKHLGEDRGLACIRRIKEMCEQWQNYKGAK